MKVFFLKCDGLIKFVAKKRMKNGSVNQRYLFLKMIFENSFRIFSPSEKHAPSLFTLPC